MHQQPFDLTLYIVTDGKDCLKERVELALQGGATCVQYREKIKPYEQMLEEAAVLHLLCKQYHVPLFINDHVQLAMELGAEGIHLGQSDIGNHNLRSLAEHMIVGISAKTVEQAVHAEQAGAHYLGVGACFPTGSKEDASYIELSVIEQIRQAVSIPIVLIGGINEVTLPKLQNYSFDGIAMISAILAADVPKHAAQLFKQQIRDMMQAHQ